MKRRQNRSPVTSHINDMDMTPSGRIDLLKEYVKSNLGYFAEAIAIDLGTERNTWTKLKEKVDKKGWPPEMVDFILQNFDFEDASGHDPEFGLIGNDQEEGIDYVLARDKNNDDTFMALGGTDLNEGVSGDLGQNLGIYYTGSSISHSKKLQEKLDQLKAAGKIPPDGITIVGDSKGGSDADELFRNNPDIVKGIIKSSAPGTGGILSVFNNDNDPRPGVTTIQTEGLDVISGFGDDSAEKKYQITGINSHVSSEIVPQLLNNMQGIPDGSYEKLESSDYYKNRLNDPRIRAKPLIAANMNRALDIEKARTDLAAHQAQLRAEEGMPDPDAPETNPLPDHLRRTRRDGAEVKTGAGKIARTTVSTAAKSGPIDKTMAKQTQKLQQGLNKMRPAWQQSLEHRPDKPNATLAEPSKPLKEDGDYGQKTESAVEALVRQNGTETAQSLLQESGAFDMVNDDLVTETQKKAEPFIPRPGHLNIPSGFY